MRRTLFALLGTTILTMSLGCHSLHGPHGPGGCESCAVRAPRPKPPSLLGNRHLRGPGYAQAAPQGPPVGAVSYPYYTTRGPARFSEPESAKHWQLTH